MYIYEKAHQAGRQHTCRPDTTILSRMLTRQAAHQQVDLTIVDQRLLPMGHTISKPVEPVLGLVELFVVEVFPARVSQNTVMVQGRARPDTNYATIFATVLVPRPHRLTEHALQLRHASAILLISRASTLSRLSPSGSNPQSTHRSLQPLRA